MLILSMHTIIFSLQSNCMQHKSKLNTTLVFIEMKVLTSVGLVPSSFDII